MSHMRGSSCAKGVRELLNRFQSLKTNNILRGARAVNRQEGVKSIWPAAGHSSGGDSGVRRAADGLQNLGFLAVHEQ